MIVVGDSGSANTISADRFGFTTDELSADPFGWRHQVDAGGTALLRTTDAAAVAAALVSLEGWAATVHLVPPDLPDEAVPDGVHLSLDLVSSPSPDVVDPGARSTQWVLYTSGTTGVPKPIVHTRRSLTRTVVATADSSFVWGLVYDPNRMAGIQVLHQALASGARLVAPRLDASLSDKVSALIDGGVNALSATPSLWRLMLQIPSVAGWSLRQITLGGEIADQRILNALAAAFPSARIVHVFASTETGAAFSVKDGQAGFPVTYLSDPPRGVRLDIREGILHVFSPGVSAAGEDGFASTGDVVEIVNDRVLFRGRASGMINVGGANVWPEAVEDVLRRHPDVVEAVVTAKPNPVLGQVVVATVSLAPSADTQAVSKRLRRWVRDHAPKSHVPASINVADTVDVAPTGKVVR